jgi:hypothetical protein
MLEVLFRVVSQGGISIVSGVIPLVTDQAILMADVELGLIL